MAKVFNTGSSPVNDGERRVIQFLREKLPDTYSLFPNVELQSGGRGYDLDVIVVSPHSIYAVEIKDWGGQILGDDRFWLLSDGTEKPSPCSSIAHKARVLKGYLSKRGAAFNRLWVQGIVVLARRDVSIDIEGDSAFWVTTLDDVVLVLTDQGRMPQMKADLLYQQAIPYLQGGVKGRPNRPRRLGYYELLEELRNEDDLVEYRARHVHAPAAKRVRLRVREVSAYLPEPDRQKVEDKIRRDYDAMAQLEAHPNLVQVREWFREGEQYVEVSDWSEAGTLATRLKQGPSFTWQERRKIMEGLAAAVALIHEHGIVHRDIQASNVLLTVGGVPQLMNFDRAYMPSQLTVWLPVADDPARSHLPPELVGDDYDAAQCSDVYSLGVLFHELLVGRRPFASPGEALRLGAMPALSEAECTALPEGFSSLLESMCHPYMEYRLANGRAVQERLSAILAPSPQELVGNEGAAKAAYVPNDEIGGDYCVQQVLGQGAFSHVYKVMNHLSEESWAMKIFRPGVDVKHLQDEFKRLRSLNHRNIARVHDIGRTTAGEYYLLLEFVDGQPLDQFTSRENRLGLDGSINAIRQLLDALAYMHRENIIHRDIKPSNLILGSGQQLKVIDFNVAALSSDASATLTGTLPYLPPDLHITHWQAGCDLFAAGIVLYELVLGQHPYENRQPRPGMVPKDPLSVDSTLSEPFAAIMRKAVAPLAAERFGSADEFLDALNQVSGEYRRAPQPVIDPDLHVINVEPSEFGRPDHNPFLTRLLTMYSQARRSNKGTRGYDQVAQATYVKTRLDHELRADVLDGRFQLVVITGNAGDGKTAFIQALEKDAHRNGFGVQPLLSGNGSTWHGNGRSYETNWDGSQDEGEQSSEEVLKDFFRPFAGDHPQPASNVVRIIGINEGRLRDFLFANLAEFRGLKEDLEQFFEGGTSRLDWLLVVNLNWRSLVSGDETSIFEAQLNALLAPHLWQPCETCSLANMCYVKYNVDSLRDPDHGPAARTRLRYLFSAVHLRGVAHITMRDLRSALAYTLFRDRDCTDIGAFLAAADPVDKLSQLYYNALWQPEHGAPQDRLVAQFTDLDPALSAEPLLDRRLQTRPDTLNWLAFGNRSKPDEPWLEELRQEAITMLDSAPSAEAQAIERLRLRHAMLRRKAYFELHTERWRTFVPYTSLAEFHGGLGSQNARETVLDGLLKSLSWAHGVAVRDGQAPGFYMRAASERVPSIRTYRFFPAHEFELQVLDRLPWMRYIEYEPHYLILRHSNSGAQLKLTLDIFEFLQRVGAGYTPTSTDRRGPYLNVELFENALSHKPYGQLLLEENRGELILVSASSEGRLRVERWQAHDEQG